MIHPDISIQMLALRPDPGVDGRCYVRPMDTHLVENQVPPLEPYDLFGTDPVLADAVAAEGASADLDLLGRFGRRAGSEEVMTWGGPGQPVPARAGDP